MKCPECGAEFKLIKASVMTGGKSKSTMKCVHEKGCDLNFYMDHYDIVKKPETGEIGANNDD